MRKSQIAVLSACVILAVAVVAMLAAARVMVARIEPVSAGSESARPAAASTASVSEAAELTGFDRVDARGRWELTLIQGADWALDIDAGDDRADRMLAYVEEGRLVLAFEPAGGRWWQALFSGWSEPAAATVILPALSAVDVAGASTLRMSGFEGERLTITASGASDVGGRDGRYRELELVVSGAASVDLSGIVVDDARLDLSGASEVTLHMNGGTLSGSASGAADIRYLGSVGTRSIAISGMGSIEPLEGAGPE